MKKILFISSTYLPQPNAVGVCVEAIVNEFEKRGYETFVVTMSDGPEYERIGKCNIYNIPIPKRKQSTVVPIRKLETAFWILKNYPLEDKNYRIDFLNKVDGIIQDNDFEMIICAQKPAMVAWFGMEIKRMHPSQKVVLYELDSLTDNNSSYSGWTKYLKNRNFSLEKKVYRNVDVILHLDSHKEYYDDEKYMRYKEKSRYVGIPLLDRRLYCATDDYINNEKKICVYAGMLYPTIRKPYFTVELIQSLGTESDVRFDFYTHGEFDEYLMEEGKRSNGCLNFCGYLDKQIIDQRLREADFLLNIGNCYPKKTGAVPSKLFSYISTGKPIIHISPNEFDTSLPYLEKYPNALIIKQNESLDKNIENFKEFIEKHKNTLVDWEILAGLFEENTSKFTVDRIIECIL